MIYVSQRKMVGELINLRLVKSRISADINANYIKISNNSYINIIEKTIKSFNENSNKYSWYNLMEYKDIINPILSLYLRKNKNNKCILVNSVKYPINDILSINLDVKKYIEIDDILYKLYKGYTNISDNDDTEIDWMINLIKIFVNSTKNKYYHPIYGYNDIYMILSIFAIEFNILCKKFEYKFKGDSISNIRIDFSRDLIKDISLKIFYLSNNTQKMVML